VVRALPAMRVSVIVPLYNKAKYIGTCLNSVAAQGLQDFEVLVVDDGSTDGGARIAETWPDRRFRVIRQANAGPGAARNRGIREARGEYVAFLDADDCWLPDFLETNVGLLDENPSAACVSGGWIDYPAGAPSSRPWSTRGISQGLHRISAGTPVRLLAVMVTYMTPPTTLVRAAVLREVGGFHEDGCRFAEDTALWLKLLLNFPVYHHLQPLTELHREASELSGNYTGPRPIEPFLSNPRALDELCPRELRPLLTRFHALRACKTACMLGYWGEWRKAGRLVSRFVSLRDWRTPLFLPALAAGTPLGALVGHLLRAVRGAAARPR